VNVCTAYLTTPSYQPLRNISPSRPPACEEVAMGTIGYTDEVPLVVQPPVSTRSSPNIFTSAPAVPNLRSGSEDMPVGPILYTWIGSIDGPRPTARRSWVRKRVDHVRPGFPLGMTATSETGDISVSADFRGYNARAVSERHAATSVSPDTLTLADRTGRPSVI